jgi:hypothetical protein
VLSRDGILPLLHLSATFYCFSGHSHLQEDGKRQRPFLTLFEIFRRSDAGGAHEACGIDIGRDGDWSETHKVSRYSATLPKQCCLANKSKAKHRALGRKGTRHEHWPTSLEPHRRLVT